MYADGGFVQPGLRRLFALDRSHIYKVRMRGRTRRLSVRNSGWRNTIFFVRSIAIFKKNSTFAPGFVSEYAGRNRVL